MATRTAVTPREEYLDAAAACFDRIGVDRTTMGDVARAAGVHRTTLYRYFTDRDELVLGVFLREAVPIVERAGARMRAADDIPAGIAGALSRAVAELRESAHVGSLFSGGDPTATAQATLMSTELTMLSYRALAEPLQRAEAQGLLRPGIETIDAARWLTRVAAAFIAERPPLPPEEQRRLLATYVLPGMFRDA